MNRRPQSAGVNDWREMNMRIVLLALLLVGCAQTPVERPPDWRLMISTPELELRYDLANIRYSEKGELVVKVRATPTTPAAFTHTLITYLVDCKAKRVAVAEEVSYNGSTVVGHAKNQQPFFVTPHASTPAATFVDQGCQRFKDA